MLKNIRGILYIAAVLAMLLSVMCSKEDNSAESELHKGKEEAQKGTEVKMPVPYGFGRPRICKIGMIGIAFASEKRPEISRAKEAAKKRAVQIRDEIVNGKLGFSEAAEKYSDDTTSKQGGVLGFKTLSEVTDYPGIHTVFFIKPGEVSPVIEGETGYFLYSRLAYEKKYGKVKRFNYGNVKGKTVSKGEARSSAYAFYNSLDRDEDPFKGPEGYIGEVIPGKNIKEYENAIKDLKLNETAAPFEAGESYVVLKRCNPIQYTFSYIVFEGEIESERSRSLLMKKAEDFRKTINGSKEQFYSIALIHHNKEKWDAPWFRISKDLFENRINPGVYEFLSKAKPGDISKPLIFANGAYVILKEELLPEQ